MFISKEQNFIYLRVPKTGSTSMSNYLKDKLGENVGSTYTRINLLDLPEKNIPSNLTGLNPHYNIVQLLEIGVIDKTFLSQANIYACLRDPISRFISRCYHIKNTDKNSTVQGLTKNQLIETCLPMYNASFHMWWPQVTWCILDGKPVNKLFLYEDFNKAAVEMSGVPGNVNYHHRNDCNEVQDTTPVDASLIQEIETLYADDVALYNSLKK